MPAKPIDITPHIGKRYGRWLVKTMERVWDKETDRTRYHAVCQCDCGTVRKLHIHTLTSGKSKSCGCLRKSLLQQYRAKTYNRYLTKQTARNAKTAQSP